jgi:hypothetical protein
VAAAKPVAWWPPFVGDDEEPCLEVHHVRPLSAGGFDRVAVPRGSLATSTVLMMTMVAGGQ